MGSLQAGTQLRDYRTTSSVCLRWELEELQGPNRLDKDGGPALALPE